MKRNKMTAGILPMIFAGVFTASGFLTGCGRKEEPELFRYQASFLGVFDTVTSVVGYAPDKETFTDYMEELQKELQEYHELYDIYHDYEGLSNIKTINDNAGIEPVVVDEKIIALLTEGQEIYEETGGRMNIAMGSVLSIWHDYRTEGIDDPENAGLPSMEELQEAAGHTDIRRMKIDKGASTVYLEDPEMSLDVGAVGKGFATEMACRMLEEKGLASALVNVGGNTRAIGTKPDGAKWDVGVQNPDLESEKSYLHVMQLDNKSLVNSGTYQRYYTVDGKQYHHIIHPDLLMPWDRYTQVSILCGDSGRADALSTAVFNMEPEEGKAFIESLEDVEAMWVYPDGTEEYSSGFLEFER
ncbi:MAG: FAD:protein FMN transferase [Lachnospiraceae bacterium]|nr:FAD:protein FMN transferase [Lachnospiraceae bacterium]